MEWDYEGDSCYDDAMMDVKAETMKDEWERQQDEYSKQEKEAIKFVSDLKGIMVGLYKIFNRLSLDKEYVFRREGHFWIVGLEKPATIIDDSKGMSYIHWLLQNPHKSITVMQLYDLFSKADKTELLNKGKFVEFAENEEDESINVDSGVQQEIADAKTIATCKKRLKEISSELDMANKNNDEATITKLQGDKERIVSYLRSLTRPGGLTTFFPDTIEKIRKAVSNAIDRAIENIKEYKPDLYQYLKNSIHTGSDCKYTPERDIPWEL
jgi:hypothetical protein